MYSRTQRFVGFALVTLAGWVYSNLTTPILVAHEFGLAANRSAQDEVATKDQEQIRWKALCDSLRSLADNHRGEVSLAIKLLETDLHWSFEPDVPRPTASLIKLPVMIEAYRQAETEGLDLNRMITIGEEDFVPGSGVLTSLFSAGTSISLRDAIRLMIAKSDNTATNLVLDQIGIAATAETMEKWGWSETKIHSLVYKRETSKFPKRSERYGLGSTTAGEMLEILEQLQAGKLLSSESTKHVLEHLRACDDRTKLAASLPLSVKFAHKTGAISNVRCDAGLLETDRGVVALVVLTSANEDQSWGETNAAQRLCAEVGRRVYEFCSESNVDAHADILGQGSTGELVETLQRTLNERLEPSPELAIDGDFGPATENAVKAWQSKAGLEPNGKVGESTWKSLGTLITEDRPVPDPEVVNQEVLERSTRDRFDGPPFVSCKSWVIINPESAEVIDGFHEDDVRDIASITKIMTALVVLRLSESDPELLEEMVQFSSRADSTIGSTAGIRVGERIMLSDLLYGLLLPSGNDAGTAIAEHVGRWLLKRENDPNEDGQSTGTISDTDAYNRFIEAMNETAQSLSLHDTRFQNPHGLTEENHHSTAKDVAELACAGLQYPMFRSIVNRRQYGAEVSSESGYRRNVVWKNTNRLLLQEGYSGVKTGTTNAAGACLVGLSEKDDERLLVVVLGASSGESRYVDARNLLRWGWRQHTN